MTEPLTPERISAILRDPDSPIYPAQLAVYCDRCGVTKKGDYLVHEDDTSTTRLGYARTHLVKNKGWTCDERGDFCPPCAPADTEDEWNRRYPVGTPVRYWPGIRTGPGRESTTRGPAWTLGSGAVVVSVEGYTGGIALTHVEPVQDDGESDRPQGLEQPMNTTPTPSGADMEPITKGVRIEGPARQALAEQIAVAYHDGQSIRHIAAQTGRSYGFVHRLLAEAGVEMRSRGKRGGR